MKYPLASNTWNENEYKAALTVLASGMFTMGSEVLNFEKNYAKWSGSNFAVFCNSGSSANLLALSAMKYDPRLSHLSGRKKIVVPSVSWSTTYMPVLQLGYDVQFIDVDEKTFNLDVTKVIELDPKEIAAVFAVNLLGVSCDYSLLIEWCEDNEIILLEDNCEAMGASLHGKKTGTFGRIGTHSTFFSHHMATMEGGICLTDDELTYEILKSLRAHGWVRNVSNESLFFSYFEKPQSKLEENFHFVLPGYNMRPTELQGAIGSEQLKKLDDFIVNRRMNHKFFADKLKNQNLLKAQSGIGEPSWFGFGLLLDDTLNRNQISQFLTENGIENRPIVSGNMLRQPVFGKITDAIKYPVAENIHKNGIMIGNHQYSIKSEIDYFFDVFEESITS